jgi:rhamnulose-1-phosphate aldolase
MSHIQRFLKGDEMTRVLWSMIPETLAFAPLGIGIVPYALPSSVALAEATLEQIKTHDVVMWEKHGTVAVGKDIMDAFDQTDVLCKAANIYMCARSMGSEPDGMTTAQMKEVQDVFNLPKSRPC